MKILLERLWERNLKWDESVPENMERSWENWYMYKVLPQVRNHTIPRSYFPKDMEVVSIQSKGFCDASEVAYSGVVYLRVVDYPHSLPYG